ncbi:MAG: alpha/beta fold hydrolase [Alphaproteobacteria bacterium]|nr:alpha/beta fold hydrolase [Alphaproteobacteria bacterium]
MTVQHSEPRPNPRRALREGPRPLPLHLTTAINSWLSSQAALPLLKNGSIEWRPEVAARGAALSQRLASALAQNQKAAPNENSPSPNQSNLDLFDQAVTREVFGRLQDLAAGIKTYRSHPYHRDLAEPATLWRDGTTRLLDFRPAGGQPVLFVPSLVNRAYILDLSAERSLLRWLAAETEIRPLLVDWDAPGEAERQFTLTDYVAGRLDRAFDAAYATSPNGAPIAVAGYCMGGLLALALAIRRQDQVSRLALLATPWNFHTERVAQAEAAGRAITAAGALLQSTGELPVDVIQSLFAGLDPFLVLRKFIAFAQLDPASDKATQFVVLEDWLNDGVPLAGPVAHECLAGWYGENSPHRLQWRIDGEIVDPAAFTKPALVLVPEKDRIVPPLSAEALGQALPDATIEMLPFGHIGMVAGARAKSAVWEPLATWLAAQ